MFGEDFAITQLAIPAVSVLIAFLAYTSQYFFLHFESVPLTTEETWKINIFALCIWICYYRTCFVDPGRLPKGEERPRPEHQESDEVTGRQRWCRKCDAYKPPRAHHCRTCKRSYLNSHSSSSCTDCFPDAFQKWIIIAPGPRTVFHISHFPILCAFYFTQLSECHISRPCSGSEPHLFGKIAICQA
jgi:ribosomal protein L40E